MTSLSHRRVDGSSSRWAVVLAGGEGTRLQPFIRDLFGSPIPKQYCTFCGTRSMLRHTVDRAAKLLDPDRILTVVGNGHRPFLAGERIDGRLIEQPAARDTAAGIFLPVTYIMVEDPEATVLIFPSDHFVFPEDVFLEQVERVSRLAEGLPEKLFLLGTVPEAPETEYGWIEPATCLKQEREGAREVVAFYEKPSREQANDWFRRGHLWNTMIVAVKVKTLWLMGRRLLPELMVRFEFLLQRLQGERRRVVKFRTEEAFLSDLYSGMPRVNFSRALLARAVDRSMVWTFKDLFWSDWGCPERLSNVLRRFGKQLPRPHRMETSASIMACSREDTGPGKT